MFYQSIDHHATFLLCLVSVVYKLLETLSVFHLFAVFLQFFFLSIQPTWLFLAILWHIADQTVDLNLFAMLDLWHSLEFTFCWSIIFNGIDLWKGLHLFISNLGSMHRLHNLGIECRVVLLNLIHQVFGLLLGLLHALDQCPHTLILSCHQVELGLQKGILFQ